MSIAPLGTLQPSPTEVAPHLVLHLHWRSSHADDRARFLFWAENANATPLKRARGRRARHPKPRAHPFALQDATPITRYLRLFDKNLITQGTESLTLLLPSTRTGPLPSPNLPQSWDLDLRQPRLEPWIIQGVKVPFPAVLNILRQILTCECPDHLIWGQDLLFWQRALILALEILTQHHYLPDLLLHENQAQARWRPVFELPELKDKLYTLAQAMPPVCRAEYLQTDDTPSSLALVHSFISHTVDYLARAWGAEAPHRILYLHNGDGIGSWLKTLLRPDPIIGEPDERLRRLASQIEAWQRNLLVAGAEQYTIAFKLDPPPPAPKDGLIWHVPPGGWRLSYHLRSRSDPNILAPAEQVWQTQGETLIVQGIRFDYPQEKLLQGLGQAAHIFPPIERSLRTATPTYVELSTQEVYQFLREAVPLLQQSGFSIILPSWWEAAGTRLGLRLHLTPLTPEPIDIAHPASTSQRPIAYQWELVLGDEPLTREAFAQLVNLHSPLVQQNGHWLRLDPEQIEAAQRFWKRHSFEGQLSLLHALRVALAMDTHSRVAGLPVHQVLLKGWLPELLQRLTGEDETLRQTPQPPGLRGQLRPYQRWGAAWLHEHYHRGLGAILADDMGLGKSIQVLAFLLMEKHTRGHLPGPTLLICPTSLLGNWRREIQRFAPELRVHTHYGPERARDDAFWRLVQEQDIVLTSYALVRRDADFLLQHPWFGVVLDEAQMIKNPDAQITRLVNGFQADYRFALTGTPIENRLSELWSLFNFTNRGYLGSRAKFRKEFALPIENYQNPIALTRLQRMVRPFILRRLKTDPTVIQDLPERLEMDVYCTLTEEQAALYQKVVEESLPRIADARGGERRIHVFNLLTKLKQILNHPVQYLYRIDPHHIPPEPLAGRSGKLDRLVAMLEELLDVGDKALIFTQFAEMGHLLAYYLPEVLDVPVLYLHGGVPGSQRQEMVNRFQEDPHAPPLFILTLKAGGLGLNLTAANHVFHYDRWWNPAVESQAADRIFRIGQKRNVQIHKFITAGTLEENIQDMLERKRQLAESIISSDESWLAQLSNEELIDLVTLHNDY